jgi:CheY-like chemotaxis protein/anti-sigma regulatory factor (Ser/Thr protein kinase)
LLEERAARAAADRANEAREEIFAVLSHELRNPAAAMFEWISLLRAGRSSPAESARALDLLASTVSMQQRLLDDLRDVVRISCGSLRLRRRPLECLAPLIENCVELFQPIARKNQIRLRASVAPSMGPVDADPERIQQVLWNLLSNAVKFTPPRGRVDVRCRRVRNAVELTVRDTGCGISPEAMPHLFERFWRGGEAFEGSGLGLFIVHGIIQLHGGVVFAATEGAGLGAIFTVRLPLMARSGKGIPRNGNRTSSGDRRVRILLVEDHRATARAITRVLSCAGHTVHHESTLDDAIQAAAQGAFELLVCDLHLPGGSGLDLLPRIREFLPPSKRMATAQPAILLSGYVDEVSAARSTAAGFAISLEKPVDAAVLLAAVQEVAAE